MKIQTKLALMTVAALSFSQSAWASGIGCDATISSQLLAAAQSIGKGSSGGYGLPMWVTYVDETGMVCAVVTTATTAFPGNGAWLGSRMISAQKANTANDFSLDGYAISTANLYSAVQPGGSLFGLQFSNPIDASVAYGGDTSKYGTGTTDPLVNQRVGGVNVFGGGLALYKGGVKIGAIGASGDTSCADHANAWQIRSYLGLQPTPPTAGITTSNLDATGRSAPTLKGASVGDEMIINPGHAEGYWTAWSHPDCPNSIGSTASTAVGQIVLGSHGYH